MCACVCCCVLFGSSLWCLVWIAQEVEQALPSWYYTMPAFWHRQGRSKLVEASLQ